MVFQAEIDGFGLDASGHTDGRTDRPSYIDARTHLENESLGKEEKKGNGGGQVVWNYGIPVEFFPFFHSQKLRSRIATRINEGQKDRKQVEQSSDNRCVLWRNARVLVFE